MGGGETRRGVLLLAAVAAVLWSERSAMEWSHGCRGLPVRPFFVLCVYSNIPVDWRAEGGHV